MRKLIEELRGGIPEKCDCCDQYRESIDLIPVSGGEWICNECWDREVEYYNRLRKAIDEQKKFIPDP